MPESVGPGPRRAGRASRSWRPSSRRRWRRAWRRWPRSSGSGPNWTGTGNCGASGPDTRPSGRPGNTTRVSRRTGWWAASWSGAGRRPCRQQRQVEEEFERWQRTAPGRLSADDQRGDPRAGRRPAGGVAGGDDDARRAATDRPAVDGAGRRHRGQDERTGRRRAALGRRAGPSHTLDRPVRRYDHQAELPASGRATAGVGREQAQLGGDRRAAERGRVPAAEADGPIHRADGAAADSHLGLERRGASWSRAGLGRDEYRPGGAGAAAGDVPRHGAPLACARAGCTAAGMTTAKWIIWADADEIARLRELYDLPRVWENKARRAELIRPKPRPGRSR